MNKLFLSSFISIHLLSVIFVMGCTSTSPSVIQTTSGGDPTTGTSIQTPSPSTQPSSVHTTSPSNPSPHSTSQTNNIRVFDPRTIKVGDEVANLKVTRVDVIPVSPMNQPHFIDGAYIDFAGQVEVEGDFHYYPLENEVLGGQIVFNVDKEADFPRMKTSDDDAYSRHDDIVLRFENDSDKVLFGSPGSEGRARLVLTDFLIRYEQSDIKDSARPIQIINVEKKLTMSEKPDDLDYAAGGQELTEFVDSIEKAQKGKASTYDLLLAMKQAVRLSTLNLSTSTQKWVKDQQNALAKLLPESVVYFGCSKSSVCFTAIAQVTRITQEIYKEAVGLIRNSPDELDFLADIATYTMRDELFYAVDLFAEDLTTIHKDIQVDDLYLTEDDVDYPYLTNTNKIQIDEVLSKYKRTLHDENLIPTNTWKLYIFNGGISNPQITVVYNGEHIQLSN
ncbi:MAG: hypothetical protein ACM32O_15200 [Clostridia bacterium]